MTTAARYEEFAVDEAPGASALYEELARGVAGDSELLALLDTLPEPKRQPNLFFAAARFLAGTPESFADFRREVLARRDAVVATMRARATQTNEAARCAALFPLLAALPQPLALLEVGASAGLCLQPDRYRYDLDGVIAGDKASPLTISCHYAGTVPEIRPDIEVAWRAGIDLNPLDVTAPDDVRWLEMLIWPGRDHDARLDRLRAAVAIARAAPPRVVAGDLNARLAAVAAEAPGGATLVVFHTAVLAYVPEAGRAAFQAVVRDLPGHWISQEDLRVWPAFAVPVPPGPERFVLALDGTAVALTAPHGGYVEWL